MSYNATRLYEDTYKMSYNWEKYLPENIYHFHDLLFKQLNAPVSLQMGTLIPFISAIAGPSVQGHFHTNPSVINFYTINIAASGVGKSQCRKKLVSDPIRHMIRSLPAGTFPDLEVNKFTRAGNYYFIYIYIYILFKS